MIGINGVMYLLITPFKGWGLSRAREWKGREAREWSLTWYWLEVLYLWKNTFSENYSKAEKDMLLFQFVVCDSCLVESVEQRYIFNKLVKVRD